MKNFIKFLPFLAMYESIGKIDWVDDEKPQKRLRYKFPSNEQIEAKNIELKLKRGLRYYDINGYQILALNKKNAVRKYKNMGL